MGRHNKSFVENFWVEDINSSSGFDVLCARMRDGRKLCKEIDDYLRQRSKIETQYVKELQKLNKQDNKEDLGGLEIAWREMKQQTEKIAHHHDLAAKQFLNVANELTSFNTEQKKVTKEKKGEGLDPLKRLILLQMFAPVLSQESDWEDKVSKLHSAAKNTYAKVNNQQKVYVSKYDENSNAQAALKYNEKHSVNITPKEMDKTRTKADKAKDELEKTDTLYQNLVKQVQEEMSTWEKEMSGLCKKFQDLDEQRIDHLRDYLWKCTNIDSQANVDHDQCCENVRLILEKCDIDNDIDHFITRFKTGNRHPARVEYKGHAKISTPVSNRRLPSIPNSGSHIYADVSCCGEPLDLVFLVDGSSRVSPSDFMQEKAFLSSQTMEYYMSPDRVRIGVLLFSDGVWDTVDFKVSVNNGDYIHKISDMTQPFGDLLINNALKSVKELFRKEGRPDAKRAVVLITSGRSRILWQSFREARQLRQEQIELFAIGVGSGVSRSELIGITSDSNNILHVDTFNSLFSLSAKLHELICPGFQAGSIKPTSYESTFLFKPHVQLSIIGNNGNKGISNVLPQRSGLIDNQFYKGNSVEQSQRSLLYTGNPNKFKVENINSTNSSRKVISIGEKKNRTERIRSETKTNTKKTEYPAKMRTQSFIHLPVLVNKKAEEENSIRRVFKNNSGIKRDIKSNKTYNKIEQKDSKLKSSKKTYSRAKSVNDIFASPRDSKTNAWNNLFDMKGITLPTTKSNTDGREKAKSSTSDHLKVGYKYETQDIPEGLPNSSASLNDEPLLGIRKQTIWDAIVESVEPLTQRQHNSMKQNVTISEVETPKVFGDHKNKIVVDNKEASSVKHSNTLDLDRVVIGSSDNDKEIQYILHIRENGNIEMVPDLKLSVKDDDIFQTLPNVHNDKSAKEEQGSVAKNKTSSSEKNENVLKVTKKDTFKNQSEKVMPVKIKTIEQTEREIRKEAKRTMYKSRKGKVKKEKSISERLKPQISNQKPEKSISQTPKLAKKISNKVQSFPKEVDFTKNFKGYTILDPTTKTPSKLAPSSITYNSRSMANTVPIVISTTVNPTTAIHDITRASSQPKKMQKSVKSPKGRPIEMNHKPNSPLSNPGFFGFSKDLRQQVASLLDIVMLEHDRMMKRKKKREKPRKKTQKQRDRVVPTPSVEWRNIKKLMQSINKESKIIDRINNQKSIKNDDAPESWNYRRHTKFRPGNEVRRKFLTEPITVNNTDTTVVSENEHCKLLPYRKDSSFYIETTENRTVVRPCPTGTAFDIRSCACTTMTTVRGHSDCQPELLMDFNTDLKDKSGKNIHVGSHHVALNNGSADFNGNSDLTIWRFTGSHIGQHLMIKARFKARKHPEVRQHVVSNCLEGTAISYGIEIDRFEEVVIFVLDTEPRDRKEIKIPFKLDQWTDASLIYDGLQFTGVVNNRRKSTPSAGNVETRSSPLRVGGCGDKKHGFSGVIDEVSLSFCIPRRQNNRRVFRRMS